MGGGAGVTATKSGPSPEERGGRRCERRKGARLCVRAAGVC